MNTALFLDKQIMDLMNENNSQDGDHHKQHSVDDNGLESKKEAIFPSYDFQPIRPNASVGLSHSALDLAGSTNSSAARAWAASDSIPVTTSSARSYGSLDSMEPSKLVAEKDRNAPESGIIAAIDRTMKAHADNLLHVMEGVSARLTQLETRTRNLENLVDDVKVSVGNSHGNTDGKLRQLENIPNIGVFPNMDDYIKALVVELRAGIPVQTFGKNKEGNIGVFPNMNDYPKALEGSDFEGEKVSYQPPETYPSIAFPAYAWKKYSRKYTYVYVDIDDPSMLRDSCNIAKRVQKVLEKEGYYTTEVEIDAYVEKGSLSDKYLEKCQERCITMTETDKGDVNARVESIFIDILWRAYNIRSTGNKDLENILILSKDIKEGTTRYTSYIEDLRRKNPNINIGIQDLGTYLNQVEVEVEVEVEDEDEDEDEVEDKATSTDLTMAQSKSQAASGVPTLTDVTMAQSESSNNKYEFPIIGHEDGNIGVFWNMNDYPIPSEFDPVTIYASIKEILEFSDFKGENVSIKAYVDDDKFSAELREKYKDAGIHIETFGNKGKGERSRLLERDVLFWAYDNLPPANVFLLSKDAELISQFEILYTHDYGVFVSDAEPTEDCPRLRIPIQCEDWLLSGIPKKRKWESCAVSS